MDPRIDHKKANVRDVARQAGVSVATVSRVLNDAQNVTDATRARVNKAIEALRFVPSSAARAINSGRTHLVGALIPTLDHAIFARFIDAVEERLDAQGLSLVVATTQNAPEREYDRAKKLLDIGAEALIVSGITRAEAFEGLVARHQVPVIATSYYDAGYVFPTIGYDNAAVASEALQHLLSLGHRHIGVLSGPSHNNDRTLARLTALKGHAEAKLNVTEVALTLADAGRGATQMLQAHPEVSALLCLSDVLAQGALLRLRADGVAVPGQVSVIGMDDLPASASYDPGLTTIHIPVADMGRFAAQAAARWVETGHAPQSLELQTWLVRRGTTGPARGQNLGGQAVDPAGDDRDDRRR